MTNLDDSLVTLGIGILFLFLFLIRFRHKLKTMFRTLAYFLPTNTLRIIFFKLGGVLISNKVKIGIFCRISTDVQIGSNSVVESGVILGKRTRIGEGVFIEANSKFFSVSIGASSLVHSGSQIFGSNEEVVLIGKNCTVGYYSILDGSYGLKIDDFVHIASPSVGIWTHSSVPNALNSIEFKDPSYQSSLIKGKVNISSNSWIGGKVTIYPGVNIGSRSVILPNSVVNKDVLPNNIVGGLPAKVIKPISDF